MPVDFQFVDLINKRQLALKVLKWLKRDFSAKSLPQSEMLTQPMVESQEEDEEQQQRLVAWTEQRSKYTAEGYPKQHFWYNKEVIAEGFKRCNAMVALSDKDELVAYLIWVNEGVRVQVDIVEVLPQYRRQGIARAMFSALGAHLLAAHILTASAVESSRSYFEHIGWQKGLRAGEFYQLIRPGVVQQETLPSGCVIALCSADFYEVCQNPAKYSASMRYFKIEVGPEGRLNHPIVTAFKDEGYVAVYFDGRLLARGKAKHLFVEGLRINASDLFVMDTFLPTEPLLYQNTGFCCLAASKAGQSLSPVVTSVVPLSMFAASEETSSQKRPREEAAPSV